VVSCTAEENEAQVIVGHSLNIVRYISFIIIGYRQDIDLTSGTSGIGSITAGVPELKRLRELEAQNANLKRMYAYLALENTAIKDVLSRKL